MRLSVLLLLVGIILPVAAYAPVGLEVEFVV